MVESIAQGESYKVTAGSQSSNLLRDPATVIIPELVVSMYFSLVTYLDNFNIHQFCIVFADGST